MNAVWGFVVDCAPFFAVIGFLSIAVIAVLTAWIAVASAYDWLKRRRTPRIPAPQPLPPLDRRRPDHDRIEAALRRAGDQIRTELDATATPTTADGDLVVAEAIRATRHAADH